MQLNSEQNTAAHALEKHDIVQLLAGAGSGKTTTLIEAVRIRKLLNTNEKVALITFTKKAAIEMKERLLKSNTHVEFVGTIHALCHKLIKSERDFKLLQNDLEVLKPIVKSVMGSSQIPLEFALQGSATSLEQKEMILAKYSAYKKEHDLLDFSDLILEATKLQSNLKEMFETIFIDEFQDTSPLQMKFIKSLKFKKLFVVGDEKQSIYKFRNADVQIFLDFKSQFPKTKQFQLRKNYRSQKRVVKLANQFISNSKEVISKPLRSTQGSNKKPILYIVTEPLTLVEKMTKFVATLKANDEYHTLVRTNHQKDQIEGILPRHISVMTIHSSKGLEFENVVIFPLDKGTIPHKWGNYEEERRLFYVAMTRAKKNLKIVASDINSKHSNFLPELAKTMKIKYL